MPLVEAKCTNCGGVLSVDRTKEAVICPYCENAFVVEKAITNFRNNYSFGIQNTSDTTLINRSTFADFDIRDGVLVRYNGRNSRVEVPEGVVEIGREAINDALEIVFPNSLKIVRSSAIYEFRGESLDFPDSVDLIESYATFNFRNQDRLKYVKMPKAFIGYYERFFSYGLENCTAIEVFTANPILVERIIENFRASVSYETDFSHCPFFKRLPPVVAKKKNESKQREWRVAGLCGHCGGKISSWSGKCKSCGQTR